jgi:trimethylamine--corrinoid protein Co-methyltransferase
MVAAETVFNNTSKHFMHWQIVTAEAVKRFFDMGVAIAGSAEEMRRRPVVSVGICSTSPLKLSTESCQIISESARLGIPCNIASEPLTGASGPVTLAGALIVTNVEVLAGITLSQLVRKGAPVIYSSFSETFDLLAANALFGDPGGGMMNAAAARMAHYYNLSSYTGLMGTDSKVPDAQAAHEKTLIVLLLALSGSNMISNMGMLESGQTWSHEQFMIDTDIVKMIRYAIQGIDVTDDTMAVDIIKQAHEIEDFLHQKHTVQYMKTQSHPKLIDRKTRGAWEAKGGTDMHQRAREEASRILNTHQPEPLSDDVKKTLREIVETARKELVPA